MFLTTVYNIYLISDSLYGLTAVRSAVGSADTLSRAEHFILYTLTTLTLFLGLEPTYITDLLEESVKQHLLLCSENLEVRT